MERAAPLAFHLGLYCLLAVALGLLGARLLPGTWPPSRRLIVAGLLAVNLLSFAQMGWDKHRAEAGDRRVPEVALLAPALLCADAGLLGGMFAFRHKTQKTPFQWAYAGTVLVRVAVLAALWRLRQGV